MSMNLTHHIIFGIKFHNSILDLIKDSRIYLYDNLEDLVFVDSESHPFCVIGLEIDASNDVYDELSNSLSLEEYKDNYDIAKMLIKEELRKDIYDKIKDEEIQLYFFSSYG